MAKNSETKNPDKMKVIREGMQATRKVLQHTNLAKEIAQEEAKNKPNKSKLQRLKRAIKKFFGKSRKEQIYTDVRAQAGEETEKDVRKRFK